MGLTVKQNKSGVMILLDVFKQLYHFVLGLPISLNKVIGMI